MMVYVIIDIVVQDRAAYAQYVESVRPIVEKYGGRYLTRGGKVVPMAGDWRPERVVLIEFPSSGNVRQWLNSPEYKEIAGLREQSTQARAILVEGVETATAHGGLSSLHAADKTARDTKL